LFFLHFSEDWVIIKKTDLSVKYDPRQKEQCMKKDGFFASILQAAVEEEKKKYAAKKPNWYTDQKKQLWYMLMNQIDGNEDAEEVSQREK